MTKVYVVILNWNRPKDTLECVNSVFALIKDNFEITVVVVDNASTDNSVKLLTKLGSKIVLVQNTSNLGFSGGNNVGIKYALTHHADYVLVLNNDTLVKNDLLQRLLHSAKAENAYLVCPKIYFAKGFEFHKSRYKPNEQGKVLWAVGGVIDWNNIYASNRGVDEVDRGQYNTLTEVAFAPGTCLLAKADLLNKIGLFDEKYFLYMEDVDLSVRAKRAGFKVICDPSAVIWHKVAGSSGIGSKLNDYYITRNRLLFGMKYAKNRTKLALIKESIQLLLFTGRKWQRRAIVDAYIGNFGQGSWK